MAKKTIETAKGNVREIDILGSGDFQSSFPRNPAFEERKAAGSPERQIESMQRVKAMNLARAAERSERQKMRFMEDEARQQKLNAARMRRAFPEPSHGYGAIGPPEAFQTGENSEAVKYMVGGEMARPEEVTRAKHFAGEGADASQVARALSDMKTTERGLSRIMNTMVGGSPNPYSNMLIAALQGAPSIDPSNPGQTAAVLGQTTEALMQIRGMASATGDLVQRAMEGLGHEGIRSFANKVREQELIDYRNQFAAMTAGVPKGAMEQVSHATALVEKSKGAQGTASRLEVRDYFEMYNEAIKLGAINPNPKKPPVIMIDGEEVEVHPFEKFVHMARALEIDILRDESQRDFSRMTPIERLVAGRLFPTDGGQTEVVEGTEKAEEKRSRQPFFTSRPGEQRRTLVSDLEDIFQSAYDAGVGFGLATEEYLTPPISNIMRKALAAPFIGAPPAELIFSSKKPSSFNEDVVKRYAQAHGVSVAEAAKRFKAAQRRRLSAMEQD